MSSPSEGEARRWFYVREGRRHGPVEIARLVDLVLGGEVPEDALVWHSGLPEWLQAREVEDIRRELPPPVPTRRVPPPPDPVPKEAAEEASPDSGEAAAPEGTPAVGEDPSAGDSEGLTNGQKRRRKRKHRRESKRRPTWLWPLIVVLIGLMIFLWWLLRRMNEVPPGRIIQTGSVQGRPKAGVFSGARTVDSRRESTAPRLVRLPPCAIASRWAGSRGSAPGYGPARPA